MQNKLNFFLEFQSGGGGGSPTWEFFPFFFVANVPNLSEALPCYTWLCHSDSESLRSAEQKNSGLWSGFLR